jgi:hypothetical protein
MLDNRICHKTIDIDFDNEGTPFIVGAPCIKEKCVAWEYGQCNLASTDRRVHGC